MKASGKIPAALRGRRRQKATKISRTAGNKKGGCCNASPQDRAMARRGRSYKDPHYGAWAAKMAAKANQTRA